MIQWFKRRTILFGCVSLLVLAACGSETTLESPANPADSSSGSQSGNGDTPVQVDPSQLSESALRGMALYENAIWGCAACHGKDGSGTDFFEGIDHTKARYTHSTVGGQDYDLVEYIETWMPVGNNMGACTGDCSRDIAAYIRSWGDIAPVVPAPVNPAPVDPAPVNPAPVDPAPVNPAPVDPAPVNPAPVDPAPVNPAPIDPAPVDPSPVNPAPGPSADIANGKSLYEGGTYNCSVCHLEDGSSPVFGLDPTKEAYAHSTDSSNLLSLEDYIAAYMPPPKKDGSREVCSGNCARDIAAYIRSWVIGPQPIDPAPVDPAPVDPAPVDPAPVDPTPVDPTPVDPTPVDPTPVDPTPVDPTPVDPTPIPDQASPEELGEIAYNDRSLACATCHGVDGKGGISKAIDPNLATYSHSDAPDVQLSLEDYIVRWMPPGNNDEPDACVGDCARNIAAYIRSWQQQPEEPEVPALSCEANTINYGRRQMRLLTTREYENSIEDLVGYQVDAAAAGVPSDTLVERFSNQVQTAVTPGYADAYSAIAKAAAEWSEQQNFAGVVDCSNGVVNECVAEYVDGFAMRAYRRPLSDAERDLYRGLFATNLTEGDINEGIKLAIETTLSSPYFLMRSEMGTRVSDIVDQVENGSQNFDTGGEAYTEQVNETVALYQNFGKSLRDFNFTGNDLFTIVASGKLVDGSWTSMSLKVDNQEFGTVLVDSEDAREYQFQVTGVTGNNKYFQITNERANGNHAPSRELTVVSYTIGDAVEVVAELPDENLASDAYVLSPYELAGFLSYSYTGSTPDDELLQAAANGELETDEQVLAQIDRLLLTPRAREHFGEFAAQWLRVDKVISSNKSAELFPGFTIDVRKAMAQEVREIFKHVMFDDNQSIDELYGDYTFLNQELANYYGIGGNYGANFTKTPALDYRGGILTSGAFMAGFAHEEETSPIQRGVAVRENMMCLDVPEMPTDLELQRDDVDAQLQEFIDSNGGVISGRDRYHFLTKDAPCSACHETIINPHGFGMEDFDAVGMPRMFDINDLMVDASGELIGLTSLDDSNSVSFTGAKELSNELKGLPATRACFAEKSFRFVMGTGHNTFDHGESDVTLGAEETAGYSCVIESMNAAMAAENYNPRQALRALGIKDIVRYRK